MDILWNSLSSELQNKIFEYIVIDIGDDTTALREWSLLIPFAKFKLDLKHTFATPDRILILDSSAAETLDDLKFQGTESNKYVRTPNVELVVKILMEEPSLVTLNLSENKIGDSGIEKLANALKINTTLMHLDLNSNRIGPVGAKCLAIPLKSTSFRLVTLNLQCNFIGDDGCSSVSEMLKTNSNLAKLDLSFNKITAASAKKLAEALTVNDTLRRLSLWGNYIGPAGAKDLAQGLEDNITLLVLDLTANKLGSTGAKYLIRSLETNKTLSELCLSHKDIKKQHRRRLPRFIRRRIRT
uniref:Uncharacterized protein n=1 Tax=Aplanochytrium stocchinoi TaxID=215587 RepID=A0A7S3LNN3_9STRA